MISDDFFFLKCFKKKRNQKMEKTFVSTCQTHRYSIIESNIFFSLTPKTLQMKREKPKIPRFTSGGRKEAEELCIGVVYPYTHADAFWCRWRWIIAIAQSFKRLALVFLMFFSVMGVVIRSFNPSHGCASCSFNHDSGPIQSHRSIIYGSCDKEMWNRCVCVKL